MANHKSALERIRRNEAARLHNCHQHRTAHNAVRRLCILEDQEEVKVLFPKVAFMIDKLIKGNTVHANKAANLKSSLARHLNKLAK